MIVNDRLDIRSGLIQRAMNEAFQVRLSAARIHGSAFEREFHNVIRLHEFRGFRPR